MRRAVFGLCALAAMGGAFGAASPAVAQTGQSGGWYASVRHCADMGDFQVRVNGWRDWECWVDFPGTPVPGAPVQLMLFS
ncbi:hypothetical protein [Rhodococcus sp. NPDC058521]|uniref:hypothetical protein n=1 Tax=Rhodococcus sp. NPDC058521 TaxID=3346536 RepID=UPI00365C103E